MRRPFHALALIPALLAAEAPAPVATAQDPWDAFLARQRAALLPVWRLAYREADFGGDWAETEAFLPARVPGELRLLTLDQGVARACWAQHGWKPEEARWVLLDPSGREAATGSGLPEGEEVLKLMRDRGWASRASRRRDFLRENPGNGDAWLEELEEQAELLERTEAIRGKAKGEAAPGSDDAAKWGPTEGALRSLLEVPGWEGEMMLGASLMRLQRAGAFDSPLMKERLGRMDAELTEALKRQPAFGPWWSWARLGPVHTEDAASLMASLEPCPGQPWPTPMAGRALLDHYASRGDWSGLEATAAQGLASARGPWRTQALVTWGGMRARALFEQGRTEDAFGALEDMRGALGPDWKQYRWMLNRSVLPPDNQDKALRQRLKEVLDQDAPAKAKEPPEDPPLRLALLGHPDWEKRWARLEKDPALELWGPEELVWRPLGDREAAELRARHGWGPEPRWVLMQGADLLEQGSALPTGSALADRLSGHGTPHIARLEGFLKRHPDRMDARALLMMALHARMPSDGLELKLVDQTERLRSPLWVGKAWTPHAELWEAAARRLLPRLEEDIRHWPQRGELWIAWVDWAALHPAHPRPGDLLRRIPVWPRTRYVTSSLPLYAANVVARRLQERKDWPALEGWGRAFWEGGCAESLPRLLAPVPNPSERDQEERAMVLSSVQEVLLPYLKALRALGRGPEADRIEREVRALGPGGEKLLVPPKSED